MWEQYRKTFRGMQISIGLVTVAVLILTHGLFIAFGFFVVMQIGSVLGVLWAMRLRRMFGGMGGARLPARRT
jgi:hypothetical protein